MSREKLLINNPKSNNSEDMSNKQIVEMALVIMHEASFPLELSGTIATALYNAGCRKQSENVIELPCKVGDTVYIIDEVWDETVDPYVLDVKVLQFFINEHGIAVDLELPLGMRQNTWMVVGKNVFLTEEEAEQALAKMKGGAE